MIKLHCNIFSNKESKYYFLKQEALFFLVFAFTYVPNA